MAACRAPQHREWPFGCGRLRADPGGRTSSVHRGHADRQEPGLSLPAARLRTFAGRQPILRTTERAPPHDDGDTFRSGTSMSPLYPTCSPRSPRAFWLLAAGWLPSLARGHLLGGALRLRASTAASVTCLATTVMTRSLDVDHPLGWKAPASWYTGSRLAWPFRSGAPSRLDRRPSRSGTVATTGLALLICGGAEGTSTRQVRSRKPLLLEAQAPPSASQGRTQTRSVTCQELLLTPGRLLDLVEAADTSHNWRFDTTHRSRSPGPAAARPPSRLCPCG